MEEGIGTLPRYSNVFREKITLVVNEVRLDAVVWSPVDDAVSPDDPNSSEPVLSDHQWPGPEPDCPLTVGCRLS